MNLPEAGRTPASACGIRKPGIYDISLEEYLDD